MNFRMLMKKRSTVLELYFLYIFIFCTGMKENQRLKEANKGLDWRVSFIHMYFLCNALSGELINLLFFV